MKKLIILLLLAVAAFAGYQSFIQRKFSIPSLENIAKSFQSQPAGSPNEKETAPEDAAPAPAEAKPTAALTAKNPSGSSGPGIESKPLTSGATTEKRVAPPGVFYLTQRISMTTDSGVKGYSPGTKVLLLKRSPSKLKVTDGSTDFEVALNQVTNDLDLAEELARKEKAFQQSASNIGRGGR
jgi:hypothetical protein